MNTQKRDINDNCFDVVRLICTFTVFFGHFLTHFSVDSDILHGIAYFVRGVPVFFFLSGLFIARSLERYSTREFVIRRAIRIFPELWVCVLLNLVIMLLCGIRGGVKDIGIYLVTQLTAFQFYTGDWLRGYGVGTPNGALWTITVDIQFYIAAIFLVRWLKRKPLKTWLLLIMGTMSIPLILEKVRSYYPGIIYKLMECNLLSFLWIFLVGMCVYYHSAELIRVQVRSRWGIIALYLIWQYVVPDTAKIIFEGIRYNLVTTLLLLMMVCALGFSFKTRLRQDYSYSFYLYHMVVINFVIHNVCTGFENYSQMVICLAICTTAISVMAFLSHKYIAGTLTRYIENKVWN